MNRLKTLVGGILGGICIGIGGAVFLSLDNKIIGAMLFTCGLFTICTFGLYLFTGKVCYVFDKDLSYALDVVIIWIGNFIGTFLTAQLLLATRVGEAMSTKATGMVTTKLGDAPLSIFLLAIMCNILIHIGVEGYIKNPHEVGKYVALFLGIMVFILSGYEHCVANMFYISIAKMWSGQAFLYLIIMTLGNAVGGVLFPLLRKFQNKQ